MVATYSPEGRIYGYLQSLQVSGENVRLIAKELGVKLSSGQFSEVLRGRRKIDPRTVERLLEILDRMKQLQDSVSVPIDWSRHSAIGAALLAKLIADVAAELADEATEALR